MLTNPKENRTQNTCNLSEQFRHKGYQCREIREQDSTVLILTHEKRHFEFVSQVTGNYKTLLREN